MKRVKILLLSLLVLGGLVMVFSLLIPASTTVSRALNVNAGRDSIMKELVNLENWSHWHPQLKSDSARRLIQYSPVRSGKDARLQYNNFSMQLANVTDSTVQVVMTNAKGESLPSEIAVYRLADSCVVNWYARFHVKWYPWEKFRSIFFDNMYGPSLEANLKGLKAYLERK